MATLGAPPKPVSTADSQRNRKIPSLNTSPEIALRKMLHARGLRYRIHAALVEGTKRTIDIAFPRRRVAIFIDGCFWHGCPIHYREPKGNAEWWRQKISRNVARDLDTNLRLHESGWRVLRFWEHDDLTQAVEVILKELASRGSQ